MQLEEKLYTSTEVADILGVSLRSVYRYLDEGKLQAEVKTATGRHRFTKQNILDFLYPTDSQNKIKEEAKPEIKTKIEVQEVKVEEVKQAEPVETQEPVIEQVSTEIMEEKEPEVEQEEEKEEQIDWLEKFRAAANKYREEAQEESSSIVSNIQPIVEEKPQEPQDNKYYYRSLTGGLKDIAQSIDKSARKASIEYAFTMNAGMSLHKPIKPFSLLHAYVKTEDKEFFERMLHLVPSEEGNAQLCLITTSKSGLFNTKKEMHGLFVVSDTQLRKDLLENGEEELAKDFESVVSA